METNKGSEAQDMANKLYKTDVNNERYKAMLLLTSTHTNNMKLAGQTSAEIDLNIECGVYEMNEPTNETLKPRILKWKIKKMYIRLQLMNQ